MRRRGRPRARAAQHEVLPPDLGHAGAHHAQIERQIDEAEGGDRQHEMAGDVGGARQAGLAGGDASRCRRAAASAGRRQKTTISTSAEPEARHGIERQRADRQDAVAQAAGPRAGDDAERRAEAEGERGRAAHQQQRVRQPLEDHVADRPGEGDGLAEIEMQQRPEIGGEPRAAADWSSPQRWRSAAIMPASPPRPRRDRRRPRRRGAAFEQQEGADDDDEQHRAVLPTSRRPQDQRTRSLHDARRASGMPAIGALDLASMRLIRHASIHVSAQFDTAQRGLLATLPTAVARDGDEAPFGDVDQRQVGRDQFLELACRGRCALRCRASRAALAMSASSSALS